MTPEREEKRGQAADWGARPGTAEKIDKAVLLLARGYTSEQAGAELGVTGGAVRHWLVSYPQMRDCISDTRRTMFEAATGRAADQAAGMIDVLVELAVDTKLEPQHRIRAALGVLEQAIRLRAHTDLEVEFQKLREIVEGMTGGSGP